MIHVGTTYNEPSWAIDLIAHLKDLARQGERPIKDAGGEQTIYAEGRPAFPDVLLFGDTSSARILQGWELKMPDTSIQDPEFRQNAETKARALGLDSFLLWNVTVAQLYVKHPSSENYELETTWSELSDITDRESVLPNRHRWQQVATNIVGYLNDLFDRGVLEGLPFIESYRTGGITALIMQNAGVVEHALRQRATRDNIFRAEMTLWWLRYQREYLGTRMELVLARAVLANWVAKILFAHILRETDSRARSIAGIQDETTPTQALQLFQQLSVDCNFWTIFSSSLALSALPDRPWRDLQQFNKLLTALRVGSVDQGQLGGILEATAEVARRRLRGQYPTPMPLARILADLCLRDIVSDRILDPCCGSGTIARAALERKLAVGVSAPDAAASVFAGDRDPQAVQIATFALANPSLMNVSPRIFEHDAFSLRPETELEFRNPTSGTPFIDDIGTFDAIACNLPFVSQAGRADYRNAIRDVMEELRRGGHVLSGRADIAAYLPFALHPLLRERGRLGIIITNAWLGTDWGEDFFDVLQRYYDLKSVVTSGAGRWFQSSDVVTNMLIMEKKTDPETVNGDINFITLNRPIEEFGEDEDRQIAVAQIELGQAYPEAMSIRTVSPERLSRFRTYGLGGTAQFVNSDWVLNLPLVRLTEHFQISRGERRGMNSLFYPAAGHQIEPEYIRPLAKNIKDFSRLIGEARREAFSCSRTMDELVELGHHGALNWIQRFMSPENIERLSQTNGHWYEMMADRLTELVMSIGYGDRLFVGRLNPPAFVDQRLVRLSANAGVHIGLVHALMNSGIGMFLIEGLGFGRGLGALDLSKDRIEAYMHVLDPELLDDRRRGEVLDAFLPLLNRDILCVGDELEQEDRRAFDDAVIGAFGLQLEREWVYDCLRRLLEIRATANG